MWAETLAQRSVSSRGSPRAGGTGGTAGADGVQPTNTAVRPAPETASQGAGPASVLPEVSPHRSRQAPPAPGAALSVPVLAFCLPSDAGAPLCCFCQVPVPANEPRAQVLTPCTRPLLPVTMLSLPKPQPPEALLQPSSPKKSSGSQPLCSATCPCLPADHGCSTGVSPRPCFCCVWRTAGSRAVQPGFESELDH